MGFLRGFIFRLISCVGLRGVFRILKESKRVDFKLELFFNFLFM